MLAEGIEDQLREEELPPAPEGDEWARAWFCDVKERSRRRWVLRSQPGELRRTVVQGDGTAEGEEGRDPYA